MANIPITDNTTLLNTLKAKAQALPAKGSGSTDAPDLSGITAAAEDILAGKKSVDATGAEITGTMTNNGAWTSTKTSNGSVTIPEGYHNGNGKVTVSVSSTTTIPTDGNAATSDVLTGKTFYSGGSKKTGTMTNRGAWTSTATSNGSVTIPAGYHNGSGKVTVNVASSSAASYTQIKLSTSVSSSVSSFIVNGLPSGLSDSDIVFIYLIRYGVDAGSVGSTEVISGMVNNLSSTCAVNIKSASGKILCRDSVEDGTVIEITRSGTTLTVKSKSFKFNGYYYIYVIHKSV
jgi:hypothetical protein